jgi:uncharacterized protein YkwD
MIELASAGEIVDAHNEIRIKSGLVPLMYSPTLTNVARSWATQMSWSGVCSHGSGPTMFDVRIRAAGYEDEAIAENVAVGQRTLVEVLRDWMDSPGHRRAILGDYVEIGVAGLQVEGGASAWCIDFWGTQ